MFTFLAMNWGTPGWLTIAAIIVVAVIGIHPAARASERYLAAHTTPAPDARTEAAEHEQIEIDLEVEALTDLADPYS